MNLTNKDIEVQNAIICAVHNTDDIEEARKNERKMKWCIVLFGNMIWEIYAEWEIITDWEIWLISENQLNKLDIIWLPPTLDRVLVALNNAWRWICYKDWDLYTTDGWWREREYIGERKLLNPDWTPCNLREQSEETKNALYSLIAKK